MIDIIIHEEIFDEVLSFITLFKGILYFPIIYDLLIRENPIESMISRHVILIKLKYKR